MKSADENLKKQLSEYLSRDNLPASLGVMMLVNVDHERVIQKAEAAFGKLDTNTATSIDDVMYRSGKRADAMNHAYSDETYRLMQRWQWSDHSVEAVDIGEAEGGYPPVYFVQWGLRNNIEIPWLNWAIEQGLLPADIVDLLPGESVRCSESPLKPAKREKSAEISARMWRKMKLDQPDLKKSAACLQIAEERGLSPETIESHLKPSNHNS